MRVAVVGGGVSGLGAAYVLTRRGHETTVFERESRVGGHVNTAVHDGRALDTGFLVCNKRNYPMLMRLFRELDVKLQPSEMSFSVTCDECGLEYAGRRPLAQWRNAASPRFAGLLWEIARWLRTAAASLDERDYETTSLEAYLAERGYSSSFRRHFIVPLCASLWSAAPGRALELPAAYAIRFFDNHGMLGFRRHRWQTVRNGAQTYVRALAERLPEMRRASPVRSITRSGGQVLVRTEGDVVEAFDRVVVATHANEALRLLEDPSQQEREILGSFEYTDNDVVLHTDDALLPATAAARASWNYRVGDGERPTVTYYLNRLQSIDASTAYLVTLNGEVREDRVLARFRYAHPRFTVPALAAQRRLGELVGPRSTAFAGAYFGNGFHEDGLASGVRAAGAFGADW
jgi:predicted NAD/FAD-binding protein